MATFRRVSALEEFSRSIELSEILGNFGSIKAEKPLDLEDEVIQMALRQRVRELENQLEAKELMRKIVMDRIAECRRLAAEEGIILEN